MNQPKPSRNATSIERSKPGAMQPVFIVGCQRSGSTLLGSMLGAHPSIVCIPEAQFIGEFLPPNASRRNVDPVELIERIERHWRFRIWDFDLEGARPNPGEIPPSYQAAIEWLVREYAVAHNMSDTEVWVEHQPGHVGVLWRLVQQFPNAKIIHIFRDGRAVAASLLPLDWGPNEIYSAARFWERRVGRGFAAAWFLTPDQLMHLRYEDLLSDPRENLRKIADFIGVPFNESMLSGSGLSLPKFTKADHALVGQGLRQDRIDAWQQTLTPRQIEIFERLTGGLLELLGYQLTRTQVIAPISIPERIFLQTKDYARRSLNWVRFEIRRRLHV